MPIVMNVRPTTPSGLRILPTALVPLIWISSAIPLLGGSAGPADLGQFLLREVVPKGPIDPERDQREADDTERVADLADLIGPADLNFFCHAVPTPFSVLRWRTAATLTHSGQAEC